MKKQYVFFCLILATSLLISIQGKAQINETVFHTNYKIDPKKKGNLYIQLDNLSFFKDNEFDGSTQKGYSLPGLWLKPKLIYYPLKNIKIEAGAYLLKYWGANKYPSGMPYAGLPSWNTDQYQHGFHALPFFRAQIALSKQVNLVLGDIYGGADHNLIEPLYNPERNLTADPEAGLQLLYNSRFVKLDAWVNWESFIFQDSPHQEAFTFGISARAKINKPKSKFHIYVPVQIIMQHKGGEIDTITTSSVQTWANLAGGLGATYNINYGVLKRINLELMAAYFSQQAGDKLPFDKGHGFYPKVTVDVYDFRIKAAYWKCKDFITLMGNPFFGAVSVSYPGMTFKDPSLFYVGAEYCRTFGKDFALGIDIDLFAQSGTTAFEPGKSSVKESSALSFSAGVYFRMTPSLLLKKFGKE
ncbi:hypothetical protein [Parabacteroides pacaensis]|uniref:hypothetical protein n=1 Tax=Parabacteroides pacaensis TaxID=2086575 RepID=UPI000D1028C6|nr:hypothetical protein [Parabacteroides pacaensis]